ncbi:FtsB family cell division protein [Schleiferilactobacillus shenzhenensis]|uniref:Septum formation initiator family protein n=1 Tax=Schleiferilactobacillus shenzhenensis LY-73 TaxID=1231336 RepID=U4TKM6_9LACO|nr:septum formation initiator family protein [Schleiferilactobacillus shenzhenensis]ERL63915.1 hypothetical protein L248_1806 [Schleiferilactobacillus shenzhenensis LY-73]
MQKPQTAPGKIIQLKSKPARQPQPRDPAAYVRAVHRRRFVFLTAILAVVLCFLGFKLHQARSAQAEVQGRLNHSRTEMTAVQKKNDQLKGEVKQLHDPDYLAKYIREKYYFSKPGEIIFSLPGDKGSDVTKK